ncbi:MAG: hypothetical protein ACKPKO_63260, partial [Candidatus Fonsibacter sp.]
LQKVLEQTNSLHFTNILQKVLEQTNSLHFMEFTGIHSIYLQKKLNTHHRLATINKIPAFWGIYIFSIFMN